MQKSGFGVETWSTYEYIWSWIESKCWNKGPQDFSFIKLIYGWIIFKSVGTFYKWNRIFWYAQQDMNCLWWLDTIIVFKGGDETARCIGTPPPRWRLNTGSSGVGLKSEWIWKGAGFWGPQATTVRSSEEGMQGARLSDTLVQCVNRFIQQVSSGNKAASSRGSALILTPANQAGFVRPWLPMFAPPPPPLAAYCSSDWGVPIDTGHA